jgi:hypothetical protein
MRTLFPMFLATLLAGCETPADDFRGVLPDERLLVSFGDARTQARGIGSPSEHAETTAETADDIDQLLGDVIAMLDEVTSYPPSWESGTNTASWGPWEDDAISGRLWVREQADGSYGWALEFKPVGSDDTAFEAVAKGHVAAGATPEESAGDFTIDFDAAAGAGGGDGEVGQLRVDYALDAEGAQGELALRNFADDVGNVEADALVTYDTHAAGGFLDWAMRGDVSDPPNGVEERLRMHARWDDTGAGRLDARITGGDLGALSYAESSCWDPAGAEVWFENSYELVREGDAAACVFADAALPE